MPAALDLIGHQFGRLTVMARIGGIPIVKWQCRCECGRTTEVITASLRNGNSTSCGCLRVERHAEATAHDLVGRVFGRLTVLHKDPAPHDRPHWICRCECGGEKAVMGKHMLGGMIRSCGCIRRERTALTGAERAIDRTGLRYGRLLVESRAPNVGRVSYWKCVCDCGNAAIVSGPNLQHSQVSCGCARGLVPVRADQVRAATRAYHFKRRRTDVRYRLESVVRSLFRQSLKKRGASKEGRLWEILGYSYEQLKVRLHHTLPPGYTWADFLAGALHIDHIIPLSVFNYISETDHDFKRAWALSNLQFLPGSENMKKGNKLTAPFQPSLAFGPKEKAPGFPGASLENTRIKRRYRKIRIISQTQ